MKVAGLLIVASLAFAGCDESPPPPPPPPLECHPEYGGCLDPNAEDYDCIGGTGDGPEFTGRVESLGDDPFGLDRDGNGIGCD